MVFVKTVKIKKEKIMEKFVCTVCGYVYDPAENDNISSEELPDDYVCPLCELVKTCSKNNKRKDFKNG